MSTTSPTRTALRLKLDLTAWAMAWFILSLYLNNEFVQTDSRVPLRNLLLLLSHLRSIIGETTGVEKINLRILTDLHILNTKNDSLECRLSIYICMCPSLAPKRLYGFYSYSAFKSLSVTGRCTVNVKITGPGVLQMGPVKKMILSKRL